MSIIGKVGRNSRKIRSLNLSLHILLCLGAITMIYPFLLMISSSVKSGVDSTRINLIPPFLFNDEALYQKYLESRYNEESSRLMDNYPGSWISFFEVTTPDKPSEGLYKEWLGFLKQREADYGVYHYYLAEHYGRGVYPLAQRKFRRLLRQENDNDLVVFNRRYYTGARTWEEIVVEEKDIMRRNFISSKDGYLGRFRDFKEKSTYSQRLYINPEGTFVNTELIPSVGGDLELFNGKYGTDYATWSEIKLPRTCPPEGDPLQEPWLHYCREVLNIQHIRLRPEADASFVQMLKGKYASIDLLNQTWQSEYEDFSGITIPERLPDSGAMIEDLTFFVQNLAAPQHITVVNITADFRLHLKHKYKEIAGLNQALGSSYGDFEQIGFPTAELDYFSFNERKGEIRKEFLWRNYAMALDQMLSDARSLRNTGIYVFLSILLAITVNPLAAYALSRFKPRFSYQVIMLFMLTMAFPAMVMGIPNFLMLKRLNLLNTFWALVLPAAADGYFIFLLKGFFDSLPREVYESAQLDGASEFRLFWQFTLWLSKPILAVIALGAFNAAYRNFLFAFIVCQDQSMWTLMVHIYELMQRASAGVGYAALVIAAIPTLAVFVFFQNIIIKGIVIPMEK